MALQPGHRFPVDFDDVFPYGALAMSVEQAQDFDERSGRRSPARDKHTNELVWQVTVIDRDPEARRKETKVKVSASVQPVLPGEIAGTGMHPVEFSGMTVTPYVDDRSKRMAYSLRASDMKAPAVGNGRAKPSPDKPATAAAEKVA